MSVSLPLYLDRLAWGISFFSCLQLIFVGGALLSSDLFLSVFSFGSGSLGAVALAGCVEE